MTKPLLWESQSGPEAGFQKKLARWWSEVAEATEVPRSKTLCLDEKCKVSRIRPNQNPAWGLRADRVDMFGSPTGDSMAGGFFIGGGFLFSGDFIVGSISLKKHKHPRLFPGFKRVQTQAPINPCSGSPQLLRWCRRGTHESEPGHHCFSPIGALGDLLGHVSLVLEVLSFLS